jgi:D-alanyl-D-alanine dipeptidase
MNDVINPEEHRNVAMVTSLAQLVADPDFIDLAEAPGTVIDLRYASANNFMGVNLYGAFNRAFLRKSAAAQLQLACEALDRKCRGYKLLVLDATRPRSVQHRLWAHVKGTPEECYIADPVAGSIHNFGFAVDVTIVDARGEELDMGTAFDAFDSLSQPVLEEEHYLNGKLSALHIENRRLLCGVMEAAGFIQHPLEWWHFDAVAQSVARTHAIVE